MKTFIRYWCALVLGVHILPSMLVAIGMVYFYGGGDAPSEQSPLGFGIGMFILMFYMIAQALFWPEIMVLCVGVALIALKSSGSDGKR